MPETRALRERAKELRCLYRIHDILRERTQLPVQAFSRVVEIVPTGWQRPSASGARIEYLGRSYVGPGFCSSAPRITESIRVWGIELGRVEVSDATDPSDQPGFLSEEVELLQSIAARLGEYLEWKQTELLGGLPTTAAHWRWRERYVEALGAHLDAERFGVAAMYLGGSTESGAAGPGSDIDLFFVSSASAEQRRELEAWLRGWSLCLGEVALQQTGYRFRDGLLDVHWLDGVPDRRQRAELREIALGTALESS